MSANDVEAALAAAKNARVDSSMEVPESEVDLDTTVSEAETVQENMAVEAQDIFQQQANLTAVVMALESIGKEVAGKGVSCTHALALESLDPGSLPENYPVNSFTTLPSPTNQSLALESIFESIKRNLKKAIDAVVTFIKRCYNWLVDFLRKTVGADKAVVEAVAQTATANDAATDAADFMAAKAASVARISPAEISKLYTDRVVEPIRARLTQPVIAALDAGHNSVTCTQSLEMLKQLIEMTKFDRSPTNLFARSIDEIENVENRVDKFLEESKQRAMPDDHISGLLMFGQVCAPVFRLIDENGGAVIDRNYLLKKNFHGRYSAISDPCVVDPETYSQTCDTAGKFLTARLTKLLDETPMHRNVLKSSPLLNVETYRNKDILSDISVRLGRVLDGFRYTASPEARIKQLHGHIDRLTEKLSPPKDAEVDVHIYSRAVMNGMKWLQADVMLISKIVTIVRRVQADLIFVLKTIERGQRAAIQAMFNSLKEEPELQRELREILERHREAHASARSTRLGR